ncbi:helix-turn-helix transcriptional regulator [Parvibaculum sp.]|uniref:helix-turn-helix domain-containing protein n=1 Tax=Parvibaculum sp. TaxID=2024848 RepID=UPI001B00782F|nr:helix-turn-helix transcriptional regulator [Parvibaculum sp.]MBO6667898.1 helix-turn-helix transcriptional regulator [Parvibaculum sp.]MBO6690511.1 helix-turn-helix transcriptional regulator [Parvibaculum sp.]MBO6714866.1 helix-turn-helix transcriptional regulator [Parvibaculum sp.]
MKRFKLKGRHIKALRQGRERRATQKEFAHELLISERQLRKIERQDLEVGVELLDRLSTALSVPRDELVYANEHPRLVSDNTTAPSVTKQATPCSEVTKIPRFDTDFARATDDETRLLDYAKNCHIVILHVLAKLTAETGQYVEELLDLMQSVTWKNYDLLNPLDGRQELLLRRRLRELLVLLKGNDVWVYLTDNTKLLPESMTEVIDRSNSSMELQTIIAVGPPGEYGEDTLKVPVDNGQPRTIDPASLLT